VGVYSPKAWGRLRFLRRARFGSAGSGITATENTRLIGENRPQKGCDRICIPISTDCDKNGVALEWPLWGYVPVFSTYKNRLFTMASIFSVLRASLFLKTAVLVCLFWGLSGEVGRALSVTLPYSIWLIAALR
jgi:hypothetical protein